jgi:hypothetical protein
LALAHDCDGPGYIIAHTIAEATPRMPSYKVKVIDLGLNVADTIRLGLDRESYDREDALPQWIIPAPGYRADDPDEDWDEEWSDLPGDWKEDDTDDDVAGGIKHLTRDETHWLVGKSASRNNNGRVEQYRNPKKNEALYRCIRVELNAMPVPVMVKYIEDKLEENGMDEKLMPPPDAIATEAEEAHREITTDWGAQTDPGRHRRDDGE